MPKSPPRNQLDPQDPLPESRWVYRRVLTFGFATLLVGTILWSTILIAKMAFISPAASSEGIRQLTEIIKWLIGMNALMMVLYLIAPSGEQIAKMFAMVAAMRSGVSFGGGYGGMNDDCHDDPPSGGAGNDDISKDMTGKVDS